MPKIELQDNQSYQKVPSSRYTRISQHTKDKLCYVVTSTSCKISSAAKILKINPSTAKLIIRKFRQMPIQEQQKVLERGAKSKRQKTQAQNKQNKQKNPKKKRRTQNIKQTIQKDEVNGGQVQLTPQIDLQKSQNQNSKAAMNYILVYYPFII